MAGVWALADTQYVRRLDLIDRWTHANSENQAQVSKTFGNFVGQVEVRRGKLRAAGARPLGSSWVAQHHDAIAAAPTIVEALREGTTMNSVAHFLNIDDLAILRPRPEAIAQAEVARAIKLAFSHVGKQYDFRFDNNTWDSIVCSELAFQTYVDVRWSVGRTLTSYTIAPDDVAIFAGSDPSRPFELVTFIHDGSVVHDRASRQLGEGRYVELLGRK